MVYLLLGTNWQPKLTGIRYLKLQADCRCCRSPNVQLGPREWVGVRPRPSKSMVNRPFRFEIRLRAQSGIERERERERELRGILLSMIVCRGHWMEVPNLPPPDGVLRGGYPRRQLIAKQQAGQRATANWTASPTAPCAMMGEKSCRRWDQYVNEEELDSDPSFRGRDG